MNCFIIENILLIEWTVLYETEQSSKFKFTSYLINITFRYSSFIYLYIDHFVSSISLQQFFGFAVDEKKVNNAFKLLLWLNVFIKFIMVKCIIL